MYDNAATCSPRRVPPGPPPGFSEQTGPPNPLKFLTALARRYGDVVRFPTPYGPAVLFNHPDYIKQILYSENYERLSLSTMALGEGLLTSDGESWRRQRQTAQPAFHQERILRFAPLINAVTASTLNDWHRFAREKKSVDVSVEMTTLTLKVIVKALFSLDIGEQAGGLVAAIAKIIEDIGHVSNSIYASGLSITASHNKEFKSALRVIDDFAYGLVEDRRQMRNLPDDLFTMFLKARDESTGKGLTDRQLRDEVVTMLIAGHETTALIISWAWYLLANHPGIENRLHAELDQVLAGRQPSLEDLPQLVYTQALLNETMRLYPPVWSVARKPLTDNEIGGYSISAKTMVLVSPYLIHRHPDYWEEPERVDPERFTPERSAGRPEHVYIPFLAGRHLCLGKHLALLEGVFVLADLAQHFRVSLASGHPVEPNPVLTLRQMNGLLATIERRSTVQGT